MEKSVVVRYDGRGVNAVSFEGECAMTQIVVDAVLREKLNDLTESLELCDESGQVLATLTPAFDPADAERARPQLSEEELQRREQEVGGYSLAEVLTHLEKL